MTAVRRRRSVTICAWPRGRFTAAVNGPQNVVRPLVARLGMPHQWDARSSCLLVPLARLDDLLAAAEDDGCNVEADGRGQLW